MKRRAPEKWATGNGMHQKRARADEADKADAPIASKNPLCEVTWDLFLKLMGRSFSLVITWVHVNFLTPGTRNNIALNSQTLRFFWNYITGKG